MMVELLCAMPICLFSVSRLLLKADAAPASSVSAGAPAEVLEA
jgi:hypothetical protein